jgi:hypothetical protein
MSRTNGKSKEKTLMRPARLPLASVALVALVAAGCGGSSTKSGTGSSSGGGSDAASVLSSIKTSAAASGPSKVALTLSLEAKGTPTDPQTSAFLSKPITVKLDGPVDATAKKADITFSVAAGPLNLDGAVRESGDKAWLQFNGKWYALPAHALSSTSGSSSTSSLDAGKLIAAFGRPSALVKNASLVGTEDVGGVKTDHVTGDIDIAALLRGIANVSKQTGSSTVVSPAEIKSSMAKVRRYVKTAKVDVYVGQDDKVLHRLAATLDGVTDASTKTSTGIEGFNAKIDISSTPTSSPDVKEPDGVQPLSQLQQDLAPLLGGLSGSGIGGA